MLFSIILFMFCLSSIFFHGLAIFAARRFFSKKNGSQSINYPPITLLKPVAGLDEHAYRNFASFCEQSYPEYQIIFGVTDSNDLAIPVIQQIIADYPHLDIQLLISPKNSALNPKVGNLMAMQPYIKHSLIIISDSDISVDKTYLSQMVTPMLNDPNIGAVTCLYRSSGRGLFNILESIETATDYVPGILTGDLLTGPKWTLGCSVLLSTTALEAIGGFQAIQHHIGEDCLLGKLLVNHGYPIALAQCIIHHGLQPSRFLDYVRRKNRWNKGILTYYKAAYWGCIFMFAPILSVLFLKMVTGSLMLQLAIVCSWVTRLAMGWIVGVRYLNDPVTKRFFVLLPFYDGLNVLLWCYSFMSKKIYWRKTYFNVNKEGILAPVRNATDGFSV